MNTNAAVFYFHLFALAHYVCGLIYTYSNVDFPEPYRSLLIKSNAPFKGTTVFLTVINLVSFLRIYTYIFLLGLQNY